MNTMARTIRTALASCLISLSLLACGGGGGGDRAPGVAPGPPAPGGPVTPPPPILPATSIDASELTDSDTVVAAITAISFNSPPTVTFTLVANDLLRVTGLDTMQSSPLSASFAKLVTSRVDNTSRWNSLINTQEDPVCRSAEDVKNENNQCTSFTTQTDPDVIADSARKVQDAVATGKTVTMQASTESGGKLVENLDGSWAYTMVTDPGDPAMLSAPYRICLEFSLTASTNNSCIDFVPQDLVNTAIGERATSLDSGFYDNYKSRQIVATATCNSCHDKLVLHSGGSTDTGYCASCHNPLTIDANSENSVDLKIMAHRIHAGITLPSVAKGEAYKTWGKQNSKHDYSSIHYPQKLNNCTRCHAGQEDVDYAMANGLPDIEAQITPDGHNWVTYGGRAACESCHDNKLDHGGNGFQPCINCHIEGGRALGPQEAHRDLVKENALALAFEIESASQTGPGQSPVVIFKLKRNNSPIDIKNPGIFNGKLMLGIAWDAATDFDNEGISGFNSLNIELDAIANSTALGGNRYQLRTAPGTVPAGKDTIGVMLFGHEFLYETQDGVEVEKISAITSTMSFFPSDASVATARRKVVDIQRCDNCHNRLSMTDAGHAGLHAAPAENPQLCAGCHGPGLGFSSVSADFRVLVHGLHASAMRETPYRKYDTDRLQYPGNLANCKNCHLPGTYTLPLPVDSAPLKDAGVDQYSTATASACAACHDSSGDKSHMVTDGGALFNAARVDADNAIETCDVCHKNGAIDSVDAVHTK